MIRDRLQSRLTAVVRVACPSAVVTLGDGNPPGVSVETPGATADQLAAVRAALDSFDWSDDAQVAWEAVTLRADAVAGLLADDTPLARGCRLMFRTVVDLMNKRLRGDSSGPILEAEIFAYAMSNPQLGDPGPRDDG